jgi:predicted secreted protein
MAKEAAFGTILNMGVGDVQIETATLVGTITNPGDINFVITCTGMVGTPLTLVITVANGNAASVAATVRTFLHEDATAAPVRALFDISGATTAVILTRLHPAATIANLNMASDTGTATGLTSEATSTATHAGEETFTPVAQVSNIGGPALSLDTEDVTTHDSTGAWEEVVATILRTGELSLDIVYDPNDGTHDATTGLVNMMNDKTLCGYNLIFPGPYEWDFAAYVTGFEPSAAHDGALTAAVKMKLTGAPSLT